MEILFLAAFLALFAVTFAVLVYVLYKQKARIADDLDEARRDNTDKAHALSEVQQDLIRQEEAGADITRRYQAAAAELEALKARKVELDRKIAGLDNTVRSQTDQIKQLEAERGRLEAECRRLAARLEELEQQVKILPDAERKALDYQKEIRTLRNTTEHQAKRIVEVEAASRELAQTSYKIVREVYKVVVLGMRGTGKTQIVYQWANPLWKPEPLDGTTFSVYSKTVSSVASEDTADRRVLVDHVFEILDYGGERVGAAFAAMVREKIRGLLIVVDLGKDESTGVLEERIREQLEEFDQNLLRAFLGAPEVMNYCSTVVLFINKSDLLRGRPEEVERQARDLYLPLIDKLLKQRQLSSSFDLEVIVGSGLSGHNAHLLMPHFIREVLPKDAYDEELMQRPNQREMGGR